MALELRLNGVQYGIGDDVVGDNKVLVFRDPSSGIEVVVPLGPEAREEIAHKLLSSADLPTLDDMKKVGLNLKVPTAISGAG